MDEAPPPTILNGLLDMLGPVGGMRKRKSSAVTMETRGWKRHKGDPLQHGSQSQAPSDSPLQPTDQAETSLPANPTGTSIDDEDDADFHSTTSGPAPLVSRQPTGETDVPHDATTPTQNAWGTSIAHNLSSLGSPHDTAMVTPIKSSRDQARNSPSHSEASLASAVSIFTHEPFTSSNSASKKDSTKKLVDHRGQPLSHAAIGVARQYWEAQRQFELCPFGSAVNGRGTMPSVDLLVRIAQHRQTYTQLVLGLDQVMPGTRTFEPPYIAPTMGSRPEVCSMVVYQAAQPSPSNITSPVPYHGGDPFQNNISNHEDHYIHVDSPNNRNPPNNSPHNTHTPNTESSSNYQTGIPNHPSPSNTSDVFADAEPVPGVMVIDPVLNEEQQKVVDLAAAGHNIFYTGSAGSGKSTVLQAIKKRLEEMGKRVRVMAPTGKVALAINGTTTWTFAGWTPDSYKRGIDHLKKAAQGRTTKKRFRETDVIIIDEISMVDNLHLERLNQVMKAGRSGMKNANGDKADDLPFGGAQVITTGDFFQLPPITPFQNCLCGNAFTRRTVNKDTIYTCSQCYQSYVDNEKWAFRSRAWEDCGFIHIQLGTIHRQRDPEFIAMLQKCRMGAKFTPREVDLLMKHPSVTPFAVKLFSTREEVRRTNEDAFRSLAQPPHAYRCFDKFMGSDKHPHLDYKGRRNPDGTLAALADHRFDPVVELKQGMPVVLLVNDLTTGLANGSQGIITGFEPHDASNLPLHVGHGDRTAGGQLTTYAGIKNGHIRAHAQQQQRPGLAWPIVKFFCGMTRTIYPVCHVVEIGDHSPYALLCRTQVPLTAGYAMSIHRSQGLTLDRVIVNLSRVFEDGQVYVALSRATCLRGLKIEGDPKGLIVGKGNKEVRNFMKEKFGV